jgi:hypothetical protein
VKRAISIFVLVIASCLVKAQSPGYCGKHFSVSYSLGLSPALISPNGNGRAFNDDRLVERNICFNLLHGIQVDFVTSRTTSIGLCAEFYRTKINGGYIVRMDDTTIIGFCLYEPDKLMSANGTVFDLYFKIFGRNYIAPFGKYFRLDLCMGNISVKYTNVQFECNSQTLPPTFQPGHVPNSFSTWNFGFSMGKQRIFKDRFLFDSGIRVLVSKNLAKDVQGLPDRSYQEFDRYLEDSGVARLTGLLLCNLYFRIGILAH